MNGWVFAAWGAFGGFSVAAVHLITVVSKIGAPPWSKKAEPRYRKSAWLSAAVVRMVLGAGFAAAAGRSGYINNEMLALLIGISTPILAGQATVIARAVIKSVAANLPDTAAPTAVDRIAAAETTDDQEAGERQR